MAIAEHRHGLLKRHIFSENARLTAEPNVDNMRFGYRLVLWRNTDEAE
jgi:hypothetical protein